MQRNDCNIEFFEERFTLLISDSVSFTCKNILSLVEEDIFNHQNNEEKTIFDLEQKTSKDGSFFSQDEKEILTFELVSHDGNSGDDSDASNISQCSGFSDISIDSRVVSSQNKSFRKRLHVYMKIYDFFKKTDSKDHQTSADIYRQWRSKVTSLSYYVMGLLTPIVFSIGRLKECHDRAAYFQLIQFGLENFPESMSVNQDIQLRFLKAIIKSSEDKKLDLLKRYQSNYSNFQVNINKKVNQDFYATSSPLFYLKLKWLFLKVILDPSLAKIRAAYYQTGLNEEEIDFFSQYLAGLERQISQHLSRRRSMGRLQGSDRKISNQRHFSVC